MDPQLTDNRVKGSSVRSKKQKRGIEKGVLIELGKSCSTYVPFELTCSACKVMEGVEIKSF